MKRDEKDELIFEVGQAEPRTVLWCLSFALDGEISVSDIDIEHPISEMPADIEHLEKTISADLAADPFEVCELRASDAFEPLALTILTDRHDFI